MSITHLTRLELKGIYEDNAPALLLLNGSRWMLPEKLPIPTGTAVSVHIEAAMPEPKPYVSVAPEGKDWYEQAAALRRTIYQRRGEFAGDSVQDLHAVREARGRGER